MNWQKMHDSQELLISPNVLYLWNMVNTFIMSWSLTLISEILALDSLECLLQTILFSSIVKWTTFSHVDFARIRFWNQPVLINKGKLSWSRKQLEPLMWLELTTGRFRVRRNIQCAMPCLIWTFICSFTN